MESSSSDLDSSCKGGSELRIVEQFSRSPSQSNKNRRNKRGGRTKRQDGQKDEPIDTPSRMFPPILIPTASFDPPLPPVKMAIAPNLSSQTFVASQAHSSMSPHSSADLPPVRLHVATSPVSLNSPSAPNSSKYLSPTNTPGVFPSSVSSVSLLASLRNQMSTISAALSSNLLPSSPSTSPVPATAPYSAFAALSQQNSSSSDNHLSLAVANAQIPTMAHTSSIISTQPLVFSTETPVRSPSPPNLAEPAPSLRTRASGEAASTTPRSNNPNLTDDSSGGDNNSSSSSDNSGNSDSSDGSGSGGSSCRSNCSSSSSIGGVGSGSGSSGNSNGSGSSGRVATPAVSPQSKSCVFESASNSQLRTNASPNSVSSFASFSSQPPTPTTPVDAAPSSPHVQMRSSPEVFAFSSYCTGAEGASLKFALVESRATHNAELKKTIIGGGRRKSCEFEAHRPRTPPEHLEHEYRSHLRTSSDRISPRSLSSMSTFTRVASFLSPNTNRASPSPTAENSRTASPESRQQSKRGSENVGAHMSHYENGHDVAIEPWPLGPTLAFPVPAAASESDPLHVERGLRILELVRPSRHRSLSKTESKNLTSPRTAISSKGGARWSMQWNSADPMICQGYLRMFPHGLLSKFRQSKRKYCALDIRLRCFFYWKTLEQRDTGRAKCFSLVVGGTVTNDTIEMTYAGGSSTAALKCESQEDMQRWLNAFELLKSGRERSVSRTNSKFVPSSMESARSTTNYSSPSRDWTPNADDAFAHTESIRNMFAVEYQKQQHVTKPAKKPTSSAASPSGHQALIVRGNVR